MMRCVQLLFSLLVLLIFSLSLPAHALVNYGRLLTLHYQEIHKKYIQTVSFSVPGVKTGKQIFYYGNSRYGYFEREGVVARRKLEFLLVPPGYLDPIEFYLKEGKKTVFLGSKKFQDPIPPLFKHILPKKTVGDRRRTPFILMNGQLDQLAVVMANGDPNQGAEAKKKAIDTSSFSFAYVMNRWDEIVWIYTPRDWTQSKKGSMLIAKPVGKNRYSLLRHREPGYLETVDIYGKIYSRMSKDLAARLSTHHDLEYLGGDEYLLMTHEDGKAWGYFGWLQSPLPLKGTSLKKVNLKTEEVEELWSWKDLEWPSLLPAKGYVEAHAVSDEKRYDIDHSNSIQKVGDQGYLLSVRNAASVFFLSPDFKKVQWVVGRDSMSTIKYPNDEARFYHQHTAQLFEGNKLLVFDNHPIDDRSRVLELTLVPEENRISDYKIFYPNGKHFCEAKGSAYLYGDSTVVSLFPEGFYSVNAPWELIEFDYKTGREIHRSVIHDNFVSAAYRAVPLSDLGEETFIGYQKPKG